MERRECRPTGTRDAGIEPTLHPSWDPSPGLQSASVEIELRTNGLTVKTYALRPSLLGESRMEK